MEGSIFPQNKESKLPFEAFKAFTDSYTRATEILRKVYNLSEREAFQRVRTSSRSWQNFKTCAKLIQIMKMDRRQWPKSELNVLKWAKTAGLLKLYYTPDYDKLKFLYENSYNAKKRY